MPETPLVSVIIPTRNRRQLVARALTSAQAQTYHRTEIIVVDDGSTDGTTEDLAEIRGITVVSLKPAIGGAAARNRGIAVANGELVAFLDSDDEWLPTKLERQVPLLLSSERTGAVYSRHLNYDDVTGVGGEAKNILYKGDITEDLMAGRCPRTVSLFLVRKAALDSVGGFDESLRGFQDTDLWIRMSALWEFDAVDEPLAVVHNHGEDRITTDIEARRAAVESFLGKWGKQMEDRIGADGVRDYRRSQLAVAQGAMVLGAVRGGHRLRAIRELGRYIGMAGVSNPRQLIGLIIAWVGGTGLHSRLKAVRQRAAQ